MDHDDIFHQALAKGLPQERAAFLEEACAGNPSLRESIKALLEAASAATGFLESPPSGLAQTGQYLSDQGSTSGQIGPYKLLQQIGVGGMGTVYMAEQTDPVQRKVALKLIKPGMDSGQIIARFEAERQALALMDHPNIAKVLDAGTTDAGLPFFVMELVQGVSITRYCDEHHLTPRERLELFIPVCQAVQHAHQKGIIHRDLKPSNVLVARYDGRPVPKVIDFGVAKATGQKLTERTMFTEFGAVIGTLEYMSPEQAEPSLLDIDTRSDIYALGVILYELLTGTTPLDRSRFKKAALLELLRVIREVEPPKPSTRLSSTDELPSIAANRGVEPRKLSGLLRGELDWIVMKALEKDRNRRYDSAVGLAQDIERYLADEPVIACPPSARYRLKKFARKHRALLATAAGFVTLLIVGVIGLTVALVTIAGERKRADLALAHTRLALNTTTDEVLRELMGRQGDPGANVKAYLRTILDYHENLAGELGDTAEAQEIAAEGRFRVARIRGFLGAHAAAEAGFLEAIGLLEKLAAKTPVQASHRHRLANAHNSLGLLQRDLAKHQDARAHFQTALELWQKLANEFPDESTYRHWQARAGDNRGLELLALNQRREAENAFGQAIRWLEELRVKKPDAKEIRQDLANAYNNLGTCLHGVPNRWTDTEKAYRQALDLRKKLADEAPEFTPYRVELAQAHFNLGLLFHEQGRRPEAITAYEEAIALRERLKDDFPSVPRYRLDLLEVYSNLGTIRRDLHEWKAAEAIYRQAIDLGKRLVRDHPNVLDYRTRLATSYHNQGNILRDQDQSRLAVASYEAALDVLNADRGRPEARRTLRDTYWDRAIARGRLGQHAAAIQDWQQAIDFDEGPARASIRLFQETARMERRLEQAQGNAAGLPALFYETARTYARALPAAAKEEDTLIEPYGKRAVELLQQAQKAGLFKDRRKVTELKKDKDFQPLRQRRDFQEFMKRLKQ